MPWVRKQAWGSAQVRWFISFFSEIQLILGWRQMPLHLWLTALRSWHLGHVPVLLLIHYQTSNQTEQTKQKMVKIRTGCVALYPRRWKLELSTKIWEINTTISNREHSVLSFFVWNVESPTVLLSYPVSLVHKNCVVPNKTQGSLITSVIWIIKCYFSYVYDYPM